MSEPICKSCNRAVMGDDDVDQCLSCKWGGVPNADSTMTFPMRQIFGLAGHPDDVEALNARNKRHGVNAHYEKGGAVIIESKEAYKKLMKLEGGCDYRR